MKALHSMVAGLAFIITAHAVPLTVMIFQESHKLQARVEAFNKECGGSKLDDEKCISKASELSADLGKHVALINQELDVTQSVSPTADEQFKQDLADRAKLIQFEKRWTLHALKCLGRTDAECAGEAKAIDNDPLAQEVAGLRAGAEEEAKNWHPVTITGVVNAEGQRILDEWAKRVAEADKEGKPRPPQPDVSKYTEPPPNESTSVEAREPNAKPKPKRSTPKPTKSGQY